MGVFLQELVPSGCIENQHNQMLQG